MKFTFVVLVLITLSLGYTDVSATEFRSGTRIEITVDDTVTTDIYAFGNSIFNSGELRGDAVLLGRYLSIGGQISQDIIAAAEEITIAGIVGDDARVMGRRIYLHGVIGDDFIAMGQEVVIARNAVILGNAYIYAQTVRIEGSIQGNVKVEAASIFLSGGIGGNVLFEVSEDLIITESAEIYKDFDFIMDEEVDVIDPSQVGGEIRYHPTGSDLGGITDIDNFSQDENGNPFFSTVITIWQLVGAFVLGIFFIYVFRGQVDVMLDHMREDSLRTAVIGFGWFLLIPFICVILFILLVTIPVSLLMICIYILLLLLGYILAAILIGDISLNIIDRTGSTPYLSLLIGLIILGVVGYAPYLGPLFRWGAIILGLGGLVLTRPGKDEE